MDLGVFAGRLEKHCKWMTAYLVALPPALERIFWSNELLRWVYIYYCISKVIWINVDSQDFFCFSVFLSHQ